jgi:hypothetical protein
LAPHLLIISAVWLMVAETTPGGKLRAGTSPPFFIA